MSLHQNYATTMVAPLPTKLEVISYADGRSEAKRYEVQFTWMKNDGRNRVAIPNGFPNQLSLQITGSRGGKGYS